MMRLLLQLKERKLVQWSLAYLAGAWLLLQVLHLLAGTYDWSPALMRAVPVLLAGGFPITLVLAWFHGEQGRQGATGFELLLLALIVGITAAAGVRVYGGASRSAAGRVADGPPDPRSVAVLPFTDPGATADQEYFADGMTEEILDALAHVPGIRVSARTSSFHFKGRSMTVREIARDLNVAHLLEGSIRRVGGNVRISARLVDAADRQLWSQTFDRGIDDLFVVQTEIARTVAHALQARLSPERDAGRAVIDPGGEAHDLFLQGLFHWNRRTTLSVRRAIDLFEQAIRIEPAYARAHAGLALAWSVIHLNAPDIRAGDALARAEASALRALAIDPLLSEAHAALGYADYWSWRWTDAAREFERAIELNPNNSTARQWYGEHLAQTGFAAEAEAQLRHAVALDPLSLAAHGNLGLVLYINRRPREAIAQLEATLRMDPAYAFPLLLLHKLYLQVGRLDDARDAGRRWAEVTASADPADIVTLVDAISDSSARPQALAVLRRWQTASAVNWIEVAFYYLHLGEVDASLDALERALDERAPFLNQLNAGQAWDPLRGHPRFQRILRALDFPPPQRPIGRDVV